MMIKGGDWRNALNQFAEKEGFDLNAVQKEDNECTENELKIQKLTIKVEKRGAAQKKATIIYGYNGSEEDLIEFGSLLRKKISTGGSARGGEILLQGDVSQSIAKVLEDMGHKVKIQK